MTHKQVIVMRKDLNMRKGKMVAQGAHASMATLIRRLRRTDENLGELLTHDYWGPWLEGSFTKICVYVNSEKELLDLHFKIDDETVLPLSLITDNGQTEFNGIPTHTCFAVGPAPLEEIDKYTGHLPLL